MPSLSEEGDATIDNFITWKACNRYVRDWLLVENCAMCEARCEGRDSELQLNTSTRSHLAQDMQRNAAKYCEIFASRCVGRVTVMYMLD